MKLRSASLFPVALLLAACSSDAPSGGDASAGAPAGNQAGSPSVAGAPASGGSSTAGAPSTFGGAPGTAGTPATSAGAGGDPGGGGSAGANAGAGGGGAGGAGAGTAGAPTTGAAGAAGGGTTPATAHLPEPSGGNTVPQPTGAGSKITTVPWAGFKGAVTYSFDDDNDTQIANYSALNNAAKSAGAHFTFFMWTNRSQAKNAVWKTALQDGHEIGNHTQSHNGAGTTADITAATTFIKSTFNVSPYVFAAPNGDRSYPPLAKPLFFINRMVSDALIGPNDSTDPWNLPTYIAPANLSSTAANYTTEVDSAVSAKKWRTFCIHGFQGGSDGAYNAIPLNLATDSVAHAHSAGAWIDTMSAVGSYWLGEKAVNNAMTMTSGTDKTYTWTLPANFPPGRYLRVTTDGGVLKQGGSAIPWNSHGYYEISLDVKSATLSSQ